MEIERKKEITYLWGLKYIHMTIINVSLSSKLLKRMPVFLLMLQWPALLEGQTYFWLCKAGSGGRGRGKGIGAFRGGGEWVGGLSWGDEEIINIKKNSLVIHWLLKGGGLHDCYSLRPQGRWSWARVMIFHCWVHSLSCCITSPGLPVGGGAPREAREMLPYCLHVAPQCCTVCVSQGLMPGWVLCPSHTQPVTNHGVIFEGCNFISLKETLLLFFILIPGRKTLPKELSLLRRKEDTS